MELVKLQELRKIVAVEGVKALPLTIGKNDIMLSSGFVFHLTEQTGKMLFVGSVNTDTFLSAICNHYRDNPNFLKMVCASCFAKRLLEQKKTIEYAVLRNEFLKDYLLTADDIKIISLNISMRYKLFRFESFSDINSMTQLINYINIAIATPEVSFALWTKNYKLILEYLKKNKLPVNMQLVISSPLTNVKISDRFMNTIRKYVPRAISFTVHDADSFKKQEENSSCCLCDKKQCHLCRNCYPFLEEIRQGIIKARDVSEKRK